MLWQYSAYFLLIHSKPSFKTAVPFLPFALANLSAENASLNDCPTPIEKLIENFFLMEEQMDSIYIYVFTFADYSICTTKDNFVI